jgi:uncharacterized membrane protein
MCTGALPRRLQEPARTLTAIDNQVRIPLSDLTDTSLHFYTADVDGSVIRFLVIHKLNGDYAAALDACQICGTAGYRQEGQSVICRNCGASDLHSVHRTSPAAAIPSA